MADTELVGPDLAAEQQLRKSAISALVKAQICAFGGLALSMALRPQALETNSGLSYYGIHWDTFPLYAVALLGSAMFTRQGLRAAASAMPSPTHVRTVGDLFPLLMIGILVTPYTINSTVHWTHRGFGASLFVLQFVLAIRFVWWTRDRLATSLLLLQVASGLASAVYLFRVDGFLTQAQLVFQFAFYVLVIRTVALLLTRRGDAPHQSATVGS